MTVHRHDDPTKFASMSEAVMALIGRFGAEHGSCLPITEACLRHALKQDGIFPNEYELQALVGGVPFEGDPDDDESYDGTLIEDDEELQDYDGYGCPPWVSKKFPHTNAVCGDL